MVDAKENNSAHKKQQLYVAIALGLIAVAIGIFSRVCLHLLTISLHLPQKFYFRSDIIAGPSGLAVISLQKVDSLLVFLNVTKS